MSETRERGEGNRKGYPHVEGDDDHDHNVSCISLYPYPWSENKLIQEQWGVREMNLSGRQTQ